MPKEGLPEKIPAFDERMGIPAGIPYFGNKVRGKLVKYCAEWLW
jgi:hypothetical protein